MRLLATMAGLLAAVALAACSKDNRGLGPDRPNAPTTTEARTAQGHTEGSFESAEQARISASKALDQAQLAQKDLADAQRDVAAAQADLGAARSDGDRQKAQQKLQRAQQKLTHAEADTQQKLDAAKNAQRAARLADRQFQDRQLEAQRTTRAQGATQAGPGVAVLPGTVGPIETAQGKVAQVGTQQLTLDAHGQKLSLQTDDATQVSLDGRMVNLRQLPQGVDARVAYSPATPPVARRIDASTRPGTLDQPGTSRSAGQSGADLDGIQQPTGR